MNFNHPPLFDPAEQAALLVAGALPPDEVALLEARLAAGDAGLASEIESYDAVIRALNGNATEIMPDPSIKQSLLDRISRPGPEKRVAPARSGRGQGVPAEVFVRRAQFSDWKEYGVPGMQRCVLFRDFGRNLQTSLIRIAPGVEVPPHPHPQAEECYVVEGDFATDGTTLFAGDYMRSPAGSSHGATRTENGCVLLITSQVDHD
jgi:quercetin dioxygenase-like cupin family protein